MSSSPASAGTNHRGLFANTPGRAIIRLLRTRMAMVAGTRGSRVVTPATRGDVTTERARCSETGIEQGPLEPAQQRGEVDGRLAVRLGRSVGGRRPLTPRYGLFSGRSIVVCHCVPL